MCVCVCVCVCVFGRGSFSVRVVRAPSPVPPLARHTPKPANVCPPADALIAQVPLRQTTTTALVRPRTSSRR